MRISAAEEEGYVKVDMDLSNPQEDLEAIIAPLQDLYVSSGLSEQSQAWNDLRKEALHMAVVKYVMPSIKSEVRRRLAADAMEVVLQDTADNLWQFATKSPVPLLDQDGEEVYDKRIMAAVYGAGDKAGPPSTLVILDNSGSLIDFCTVHNCLDSFQSAGWLLVRRIQFSRILKSPEMPTELESS